MSTQKYVQRLIVAEYLTCETCERQGEVRHEFIDGELFAIKKLE
jgi:Uma2 family endonuclease